MENQTFAQKNGNPINWWVLLETLKALAHEPEKIYGPNWKELWDIQGEEDLEDMQEFAESKAESWVTCAVGNQCEVIPRVKALSYAPADHRLRKLGMDFMKQLTIHENYPLAMDILHQIEARSAELIAEIQNNQK